MKNLILLGLVGMILAAAAAIYGQPEVIIQHRINPHSQSPNRLADAPTAGSTGVITPVLSYHGGPLIGTPTIYIIWYGNWNNVSGSDTAAGQQIIRDFADNIGGSAYFSINKVNSVSGKTITGNVNFDPFANEYQDPGTKTRLRDGDIRSIVSNAISGGHLHYDANGIYFVITSSNISEQSGFCSQYCGWHTAATVSSGRIRYSFVGNANRCLSACAAQSNSPNGNAGVDGAISVMAHELEEATTDPDLNAWYDSSGAENADKCAWTFGQTFLIPGTSAYYNVTLGGRNYLIQRNLWTNGSNWYCRTAPGV